MEAKAKKFDEKLVIDGDLLLVDKDLWERLRKLQTVESWIKKLHGEAKPNV